MFESFLHQLLQSVNMKHQLLQKSKIYIDTNATMRVISLSINLKVQQSMQKISLNNLLWSFCTYSNTYRKKEVIP